MQPRPVYRGGMTITDNHETPGKDERRVRWAAWGLPLVTLTGALWFAGPVLLAVLVHLVFLRSLFRHTPLAEPASGALAFLSVGLLCLCGSALFAMRTRRRVAAWGCFLVLLGLLTAGAWWLRPPRYLERRGTTVSLTRWPVNWTTGETNLLLAPTDANYWRRGIAKPIAPADPHLSPWFDGLTGEPLLWHHRTASNRWDFFNGPGIHPERGVLLLPVTPEVRDEWSQAEEQRRAETERQERERVEGSKTEAQSQARPSQPEQYNSRPFSPPLLTRPTPIARSNLVTAAGGAPASHLQSPAAQSPPNHAKAQRQAKKPPPTDRVPGAVAEPPTQPAARPTIMVLDRTPLTAKPCSPPVRTPVRRPEIGEDCFAREFALARTLIQERKGSWPDFDGGPRGRARCNKFASNLPPLPWFRPETVLTSRAVSASSAGGALSRFVDTAHGRRFLFAGSLVQRDSPALFGSWQQRPAALALLINLDDRAQQALDPADLAVFSGVPAEWRQPSASSKSERRTPPVFILRIEGAMLHALFDLRGAPAQPSPPRFFK